MAPDTYQALFIVHEIYQKIMHVMKYKKEHLTRKISRKKYILKITKWYVHTRMSLPSPEFSSII